MKLVCLQLHAPPFPPYVRQLVKEGECYSWGAFGWMLNSGQVNIKKYSYFVIVDASVRGPFISPYVPVSNSTPGPVRPRFPRSTVCLMDDASLITRPAEPMSR